MISVTRLDGSEVMVSSDHLLFVERTPDTVLTLTTGDRMVVKEPVEELVAKVIAFRRQIAAGLRVVADDRR